MPRYKKETLLAMERAKHPEDNIINVEYIRNRYLNKDPITKEEIETGLKNAFSEVFNNRPPAKKTIYSIINSINI